VIFALVIVQNLFPYPYFIYQANAKYRYTTHKNIHPTGNYNIRSLVLCCAWDEKIRDGNLSYTIINADQFQRRTIQDSLKQWAAKVVGLQFVEVSSKKNADIVFRFISQETVGRLNGINDKGVVSKGGVTVGKTTNIFDTDGLISNAKVLLFSKAFGNNLSTSTLTNVATHEIGHALGLGHATFQNDLMSPNIVTSEESISDCDIRGVLSANRWKFMDFQKLPQKPSIDSIIC
jgi:hypothetical protein